MHILWWKVIIRIPPDKFSIIGAKFKINWKNEKVFGIMERIRWQEPSESAPKRTISVLFALFPLTDASLPAENKNKNQTKYSRFGVGDFETDGFSLQARQKRVQCCRIGKYFNDGWTEIRLFKTGSDDSCHLIKNRGIWYGFWSRCTTGTGIENPNWIS